MHNPLLMCVFERLCDLSHDGDRFVDRQRSTRDAIGERRAFHQLEDQRLRAFRFLEAVDGPDVRMIQGGENLSFALEARQAIEIECELRREDLDRDVAIQLRIARPIHLPHPARA
jgi:hypothetical protein